MDEKITNTVLALSIGSIVIILSIMVAKIIIIIKYLENTSRGSLAISIPSVIRQSFKAPFFNYPFYCLILNKGWVDIRRTSAFFFFIIITIILLLFHYAGQLDQWEQTDWSVRCFPPEFFMIIVNAVRTARYSFWALYLCNCDICFLTSHILFDCGSRGSIEIDVQVC